MGIPAGRKLYPCPTHDIIGRVWVLPMGMNLCPYHAHMGTVPAGTRPMGKIAILILRSIDKR
jgi:hypothetical protein